MSKVKIAEGVFITLREVEPIPIREAILGWQGITVMGKDLPYSDVNLEMLLKLPDSPLQKLLEPYLPRRVKE